MPHDLNLTTLFDIVPAMVCVANKNGYFEYLNPEWEKVLGYSPDELLSKPLFDFIHPDDHEATRQEIHRQLQGGTTLNFENRYRCKDGRYKVLEWRATPAEEDRLFAVAMDITERKMAEAKLRQKEIQFRQLFENSPLPYQSLDETGHVLEVNQKWLDTLGYDKHEVIGKWFGDFLVPDSAAHFDQKFPLFKHACAIDGVEFKMIKKSQDIIHVFFNGRVQLDESNQFVRTHCIFTDISKLKRSQMDLEKERQLFKTILDQIPVMLTRYDPNANMLFLNREFEKLIGWTTAEVQNMDMMEKVYPDPEYRQKAHAYMQKATKTWKEFRVTSKTGNIIESEWSNIRLADGTQIGIGIDIRDRKRAERESLVLKTAIDQAPVGIALADENINIYYCNPEGLGMRGGDIKNLVEIPKDAFENWQVYMLNGRPYEIADLPLVRAIKHGKTIREEFIVRHQDGEDHICDAIACPVFENEKVIGGIVIFLDITERKKIEASLVKSKERLNLVIKGSNDAPWDWDLIENHLYYSPQWWAQIGYAPEELPDDPELWRRLMHPVDADRVNRFFQNALENGTESYEVEFRMLHKKGHYVPLLSRGFITRDGNGKPVRVSGTNMDLTERKQIEKALQHAQKMESIGTLAGGIAHEFNNILSIIMGNNEMIIEDLPEWSFSRESADEIRLECLRARDIVRHLLTFSRHDDSEKKPIDISSVAKESLKLIRSTTPANIDIRDNISPECLPVFGNATQINQILINLCTNAAYALPASGGRIEIQLHNLEIGPDHESPANLNPGRYVRLAVIDNGSGIDPSIADRIFDPYFTTKEIGEGSGLGLAVVHGIIENHGGSITCDSSQDRGTTFVILIPAYDGSVTDKSHDRDLIYGNGENILYVDDDPSIAKLGSRHLEALGYHAVSATSPAEALALVKSNPNRFDLVISDMAMPEMTGDQLITEILRIHPGMPTIISTGYSDRMSEAKASEIGAAALIMKPLNRAELARIVKQVLEDRTQN